MINLCWYTISIADIYVVDCSDGTYGELCENKCLCVDGIPCDKINGTCPPGGCEPGYHGDSCSQGMSVKLNHKEPSMT